VAKNFVLVPGAGGGTWYWNRLVSELRARGHEAIRVDLPTGDASAGLTEYTDFIVNTIGDRDRIVLIAQSMAGFSAPQACERVPVELLVMLCAMTPAPGESPGEWWANTGQPQAAADYGFQPAAAPGPPTPARTVGSGDYIRTERRSSIALALVCTLFRFLNL